MIALSKEIQEAVQKSEDKLVRAVDPETNIEYVVVPAETFEQMRNGVYYDDGPLTEEEQNALLIEFGRRAGWDDPEMDVYNDLDPRRKS